MPKHVFDHICVTGDATIDGSLIVGGTSLDPTVVGTPATNVSAEETGDNIFHITTLTVNNVAVTIGDTLALGVGALLYTFPAGVQFIKATYYSLALSAVDAANQADTPVLGLGTTIASGAVSVLSGTAAFQNISVGTIVTDCDGTPAVLASTPTAGTSLALAAGGSKTLYVNYADIWGNGTDQSATLSGTLVIEWTQLA